MVGRVMPPPYEAAAAARMPTVGVEQRPLCWSLANSFKVTAVADRMALHLQPGAENNPTEFFNLCVSLARGIDYAIANNEILPQAQDLPALLRQVCKLTNDLLLQAAIMVLMISVKNACKIGWFKENETQEIYSLADEFGSNFSSAGDMTSITGISNIPTVMSRFYPLMKMGQILVSLEVKPGYEAYAIDFHISKITNGSLHEKIYLFVAQTDITETSSCIINPQQVNFLLNGKGVDWRTNVLMDTGPQMPTNVTSMLKYGTNLLQAVGQFDGHYVIAVAFMSVTPLTDSTVLQDYVQSSAGELDPDSDLIEGPSRISLNCPISFTRIRIPVKGSLCKHHQCFDYRNFILINMRRPSWRCPHCNQHLCHDSIRIDQNMVKVLKDVGENVSNVIISADGSWKAVFETANNKDQKIDYLNEKPDQQEGGAFLTRVPIVVDLLADNDGADIVNACEVEDRKLFQPALNDLSMPCHLNYGSVTNTNVTSQIADDFWSNVLDQGSVFSSIGSDPQIINGSMPAYANVMTSPGSTGATSAMQNQLLSSNLQLQQHANIMTFLASTNAASAMQNQLLSSNLQLQQAHFVNSFGSNGFCRSLPFQSPATRTPLGVHAISSRPLVSSQQQRSRTNVNALTSHFPPLASQVAPSMPSTVTVSCNLDRQQQHPRTHNMGVPASQHQSVSQVIGPRAPSQNAGAYGASSPGLANGYQNLYQHQNIRMPLARSSSPSAMQLSSPLSRVQIPQGVSLVVAANIAGATNNQRTRFSAPGHHGVHTGRQIPSEPVQSQTPRAGISHPVNGNELRTPAMGQRGNLGTVASSIIDGQADLQSGQDWRPSGRMRGSLSGLAYSTALREYIIQPFQPAQAPEPASHLNPPTSTISPALQELLARRNDNVSRAPNTTVTDSDMMNRNVGALP